MCKNNIIKEVSCLNKVFNIVYCLSLFRRKRVRIIYRMMDELKIVVFLMSLVTVSLLILEICFIVVLF